MAELQNQSQDEVGAIISHFGAALKDPTKPFALLVNITIHDRAQERIEAAFAKARIPTLKDKGVITFDLNRETSDGCRFVVYERWETLADLEAHLRTSHIMTLRRELDPLMSAEPQFHVLVPLCE